MSVALLEMVGGNTVLYNFILFFVNAKLLSQGH